MSAMPLAPIKNSAHKILDTVPRFFGIQKIPAFLRDSAGPDELKLPLPSYSQTDTYSCGAIAGWSVLEFLRPRSGFKRFYADCAPHPDNGTSTTRLTKALRRHGIQVGDRKDLDFDEIKKCLHQGKPILVAIDQPGVFDDEASHWVVIYGCGWRPNRVFLSGKAWPPGFSRETFTYRDFKSIWISAGEGLVCSVRRTSKKK